MISILAYTGIVGLALSLVVGIIGFVMALRPWSAYLVHCRKTGIKPGFIWSSRFLDSIEPDSRRNSAKRGILLHGIGLAGAVLFFPLVLLAGMAQ